MSCPRGCCGSYKEHLRAITITTSRPAVQAERREMADMDAYKRLVQSGVQPKKIEGAAELERGAETKHEVEHASLYTNRRQRSRLTKAFEEAATIPTGPPDAA